MSALLQDLMGRAVLAAGTDVFLIKQKQKKQSSTTKQGWAEAEAKLRRGDAKEDETIQSRVATDNS